MVHYYVQVNLVRLNKLLLRNGQVNTFGRTIYFAVDGTFRIALSTTQETSMEQRKPDSKSPDWHNPFLSQANGISFRRKI